MPTPVPPQRGARSRPLLVTSAPDVLEELLRLCAAAGVEPDVVPGLDAARAPWAAAPLVVVADDAVRGSRPRWRPSRREGVVLLGDDLDDAGVWVRAVEVGAEHVVFLPDAESWLVARLADTTEPPGALAPVVSVVGGRGGAGATVLACGLAGTAVRTGRRALLLDGDPLGGGIDLVVGAEDEPGVRWPDLAGSRGRLPAAALCDALPRVDGLGVLSWDRGEPRPLPGAAVAAVLSAGRKAHDVVVADLPRSLDEGARAVLEVSAVALLVVPAQVRAAAAAGRAAAGVAQLCPDVRVVVRTPGPVGLTAAQVAGALGLPLAGDLRDEPHLPRALERGEAPARRGRGPLFRLCAGLLDDVLAPAREAA